MYKHANRTIVWLGPKSRGIEEAFNLARDVAQIRTSFGVDILTLASTNTEPVNTAHELILDMFNANNEAADRLTELLERDYFFRTWCIQEVVVSNWCVAKCEDLETNFMDLLSTAIFVYYYRQKSFFAQRPLEFWNSIYMKGQTRHSSPSVFQNQRVEGSLGPLLLLLAGTRDFQATDARDKIFSLLGISDEGLMPVLGLTRVMASNKNSLSMRLLRHAQDGLTSFAEQVNRTGPGVDFGRHKALKPDYTRDTLEVYRDLARFMIRASPRMLDVLSFVQHSEDPSTSVFPSWVPKWFQPRSVSPIGGVGCFLAGLCDGHFRYFAVVHDCPLTTQPMRPNVLLIDGYFIDRVTSVSDVMESELLQCPPIEASWHQLFGSSLFPLLPCTYRNGELLQMVFCKTLMADCLGGVMDEAFSLSEDATRAKFMTKAHANAAAYLLSNDADRSALPPSDLASLTAAASDGSIERYIISAGSFSLHRRVYLTHNGFVGIGPRMMRPGDEVCVLFGGRAPFVLRRMQDHHILLGDTYLHDENIMWGNLTEGVRFRKQLPIMTYEIR
ncbi:MAG: hypothetical protein LQ342_003980 [Letrouitia transgressa]|nr:MAG: hypothetical protein LQ342_003980 [Letrouitia transgressa]